MSFGYPETQMCYMETHKHTYVQETNIIQPRSSTDGAEPLREIIRYCSEYFDYSPGLSFQNHTQITSQPRLDPGLTSRSVANIFGSGPKAVL